MPSMIFSGSWTIASANRHIEPIGGRGCGEQMQAEFGKEMRRHRKFIGLSKLGCTQPSRDAADPGKIGHDKVARPGLECRGHCLDAVEILTELQGNFAGRGDFGVTLQIIVPDRFLQPRMASEASADTRNRASSMESAWL